MATLVLDGSESQPEVVVVDTAVTDRVVGHQSLRGLLGGESGSNQVAEVAAQVHCIVVRPQAGTPCPHVSRVARGSDPGAWSTYPAPSLPDDGRGCSAPTPQTPTPVAAHRG